MSSKQKRRLITFKPMLVYNGDDFVRDVRTFVIYYTLNRQKYRRAYTQKLSNDLLVDIDCKVLASMFWHDFKTELNIFQCK